MILSDVDAAAALHCSTKHLQRLARNGEVEGAKVGRGWVFTQEAIEALVRKRSRVAVQPKRRRKPLPRI